MMETPKSHRRKRTHSGSGHKHTKRVRSSSSSTTSSGQKKSTSQSPDTSQIRDIINNIRKIMKLSELKPNRTLISVAESVTYSTPFNLNFNGTGYTIVSMYTISKLITTSSSKKIVSELMLDSKYRNILLSPGNYAAIELYPLDDGRKKITIVIASVFR